MTNESSKKEYDIDSVAKILGIKPDMVKILIEKFLEQAKIYIENIDKAITENDIDSLCHSSHKFYGIASNLRFTELAFFLKEIEKGAKESGNIDFRSLFVKIKEEFNKI